MIIAVCLLGFLVYLFYLLTCFVYLFAYMFTSLFVYLLIYLFYLFTCLFTCLLVHSFLIICLFTSVWFLVYLSACCLFTCLFLPVCLLTKLCLVLWIVSCHFQNFMHLHFVEIKTKPFSINYVISMLNITLTLFTTKQYYSNQDLCFWRIKTDHPWTRQNQIFNPLSHTGPSIGMPLPY